MRKLLRFSIVFTLCCTASCLAAQDAERKKSTAPDDDKLTLKLYPLGELVTAGPQFPYSSALPTSQQFSQQKQPVPGAGGISASGGGGTSGAGAGFFSVPSSTQFGPIGNGFSQGGISGGGGFQPGFATQTPVQNIINAITMTIAPDSWQAVGGDATIAAVRDVLIVQQTSQAHEQIEMLLDELSTHTVAEKPLTLDIWWLPGSGETRQSLKTALNEKNALQKLHDLSQSCNGHHGTITSRSGTTANIVSGHRAPLVTGRIPVVGTNALGYQQIINHVNIGVFAEANMQLHDSEKNQTVRLTLKTAVTTLEDFEGTETTGGDIDRFLMGNHVLETVISCSIGKPLIAGGLSNMKTEEKEQGSEETIVVVCVSDS